jgi:hypothetical protein
MVQMRRLGLLPSPHEYDHFMDHCRQALGFSNPQEALKLTEDKPTVAAGVRVEALPARLQALAAVGKHK